MKQEQVDTAGKERQGWREQIRRDAEEKDSSRARAVLENRNSRVDTPLQIVRVTTPPRFKSHASRGISAPRARRKKTAGRKMMLGRGEGRKDQ